MCINSFSWHCHSMREVLLTYLGKMRKLRHRDSGKKLAQGTWKSSIQTQAIWLHFRRNQPACFVYGVLEPHGRRCRNAQVAYEVVMLTEAATQT